MFASRTQSGVQNGKQVDWRKISMEKWDTKASTTEQFNVFHIEVNLNNCHYSNFENYLCKLPELYTRKKKKMGLDDLSPILSSSEVLSLAKT